MIDRGAFLRTAAAAVVGTSVRDLGARGDGTSDDTAALQAALDRGGAVYLPPGRYRVAAPLLVPSNRPLQLSGAGPASVVLWGFASDLFVWQGPAAPTTVADLAVAGSVAAGTAFSMPAGATLTTFLNVVVGGYGDAPPVGSAVKIADARTAAFLNCDFLGITGTGIELRRGHEVRIVGGRIVGADLPGRASTGVHLTGDCGGIHVVETDLISHRDALRIENLGVGSNREVFLTHATLDSSDRGLVVLDGCYVSVVGLWAASCKLDNVFVGDGGPLLSVAGGTIFNAGVDGGRGNGMTVRSGSFTLTGVSVRSNKGHGVFAGPRVRDSTIAGCRFTDNLIGVDLRGRGIAYTGSASARNARPSRFAHGG